MNNIDLLRQLVEDALDRAHICLEESNIEQDDETSQNMMDLICRLIEADNWLLQQEEGNNESSETPGQNQSSNQ